MEGFEEYRSNPLFKDNNGKIIFIQYNKYIGTEDDIAFEGMLLPHIYDYLTIIITDKDLNEIFAYNWHFYNNIHLSISKFINEISGGEIIQINKEDYDEEEYEKLCNTHLYRSKFDKLQLHIDTNDGAGIILLDFNVTYDEYCTMCANMANELIRILKDDIDGWFE